MKTFETTITQSRTEIFPQYQEPTPIPAPKTGEEYLKMGALENLSDETLKQIITVQFEKYVKMAREKLGVKLNHLQVVFKKRGISTGGTCMGAYKIDYNLDWARANLQGFLTDTVPHEICHAIEFELYGVSGHSSRWKRIMMVMGIKPTRTVHADMSGVKPVRKTKEFKYAVTCGCSFNISATRHKRLQSGIDYRCTKHGTKITASDFLG